MYVVVASLVDVAVRLKVTVGPAVVRVEPFLVTVTRGGCIVVRIVRVAVRSLKIVILEVLTTGTEIVFVTVLTCVAVVRSVTVKVPACSSSFSYAPKLALEKLTFVLVIVR